MSAPITKAWIRVKRLGVKRSEVVEITVGAWWAQARRDDMKACPEAAAGCFTLVHLSYRDQALEVPCVARSTIPLLISFAQFS